jgi:hypothetical protein
MWKEPPGQATYEMANLRPERTGLPFVVFISQRAGANHAARVKVSKGPRVHPDDMGVYAVKPFRHVAGPPLSSRDEATLERWIAVNEPMLVAFWDGDIEYTEDAIDRVIKV